MASDFTDQPVAVEPGQLSAADIGARVLRYATAMCEQQIDYLPQLIATGRISEVTAQQADRYLCGMREVFTAALEANGETVPQSIR